MNAKGPSIPHLISSQTHIDIHQITKFALAKQLVFSTDKTSKHGRIDTNGKQSGKVSVLSFLHAYYQYNINYIRSPWRAGYPLY